MSRLCLYGGEPKVNEPIPDDDVIMVEEPAIVPDIIEQAIESINVVEPILVQHSITKYFRL